MQSRFAFLIRHWNGDIPPSRLDFHFASYFYLCVLCFFVSFSVHVTNYVALYTLFYVFEDVVLTSFVSVIFYLRLSVLTPLDHFVLLPGSCTVERTTRSLLCSAHMFLREPNAREPTSSIMQCFRCLGYQYETVSLNLAM
jgi:hypothetical protein